MTDKQRAWAAIHNQQPDKVPHFELVFQIPEQAFGMSWPTAEEARAASPAERAKLFDRFIEINERIIDRYHWGAIAVPTELTGFYGIPRPIEEAKRRLGDKTLIYDWNGQGTFWLMDGQGMMDFSIRLFERPEDVHREARAKCEASKALAREQVDQGVDFICINSDYAFNRGPFISPKMFAEFVTPYLHEIVDEIHRLGVKAMLHSDGDLSRVLDQLVSTGLDGYQSVDPQGGMDIKQVKADYGDRLFLMGNVQSAMLQDTDEDKIRQSVRYAMEHGKPGGGFILSTSNCIFNGMPLESYHVMLDEYEKLAWY